MWYGVTCRGDWNSAEFGRHNVIAVSKTQTPWPPPFLSPGQRSERRAHVTLGCADRRRTCQNLPSRRHLIRQQLRRSGHRDTAKQHRVSISVRVSLRLTGDSNNVDSISDRKLVKPSESHMPPSRPSVNGNTAKCTWCTVARPGMFVCCWRHLGPSAVAELFVFMQS